MPYPTLPYPIHSFPFLPFHLSDPTHQLPLLSIPSAPLHSFPFPTLHSSLSPFFPTSPFRYPTLPSIPHPFLPSSTFVNATLLYSTLPYHTLNSLSFYFLLSLLFSPLHAPFPSLLFPTYPTLPFPFLSCPHLLSLHSSPVWTNLSALCIPVRADSTRSLEMHMREVSSLEGDMRAVYD